MTGFEIILDKVTILGLLTLIGFTFFKLKWLGPEVKQGLQKLVFNLTLPLMIFTTISGFQFSGELLGNGLTVFLLAYPFLFLQYGLGWATAKVFRLPLNKESVHVLHTTFGNVVFLGYPLIDALFPDTPALFYAAIYHIAQMTIIYTYGIYRLDSRHSTNLFSNLKKLINPNTMAFVAGFLFMVFNLSLPTAVNQTFSGVGSSTLYLSMIYIGMLVAGFKPKLRDFRADVLLLNFNKLLIAPFLVFFILVFLIRVAGLSLSFPALGAIVLQTAMPCMAILVILAKTYGADENSAMVNVFTTTIISLITLPFIYWFIISFPVNSFF